MNVHCGVEGGVRVCFGKRGFSETFQETHLHPWKAGEEAESEVEEHLKAAVSFLE